MSRARQHRISTPTARRELTPRREPYWNQLRRGGHIGFRRVSDGGTWIAKWRNADGKRNYRKLGTLADYPEKERYTEASRRANDWFDTCAQPDAVSDRYTVSQAADHYKEHLLAEKGPRAEKDAEMRIKAYILPTFEKTYLDELSTAQLTRWRNTFVPDDKDEETLRKARDTANRHLNTFKALLNRAYKDGLVSVDTAWRNVARFEKAGVARKVLLSDAQIKRLLDKSQGGFHNLVKGLLLTGLRPGIEIEHIICEQLTPDGYLEIRESKTGPREVHLSSDALSFLNSLAKDKTPKARLFARDDGKAWVSKEPERAMRAMRKTAKLPAETVLYSLRHTYISRALEHGASVKLIADNCGTSIRMIEKHYWKSIQSQRQEMLDQVSVLPLAGGDNG